MGGDFRPKWDKLAVGATFKDALDVLAAQPLDESEQ
jgi:hypothetical protein